jgi:hypothetical protein
LFRVVVHFECDCASVFALKEARWDVERFGYAVVCLFSLVFVEVESLLTTEPGSMKFCRTVPSQSRHHLLLPLAATVLSLSFRPRILKAP